MTEGLRPPIRLHLPREAGQPMVIAKKTRRRARRFPLPRRLSSRVKPAAGRMKTVGQTGIRVQHAADVFADRARVSISVTHQATRPRGVSRPPATGRRKK